MKKLSVLAAIAVIGAGLAASSTGQYTPWSQPPKAPRTKPGNSLVKSRSKAQQKARRAT